MPKLKKISRKEAEQILEQIEEEQTQLRKEKAREFLLKKEGEKFLYG